jgi:hypothetical protein
LFVPAKPRWWLHIPEIRTMLVDAGLPVVDRAAVERLFGLQRRQAIELMHHFGGYQAGRTFLIAREQILAQLDSILATGEYEQETTRRERLTATIETLQRTRQTEAVRIGVPAEVFDSRMQTLSPGVHLQAGKLEIEFVGPEDLLRKLFGLAQAVANDYAEFERAATGGAGRERIPA